MKKLKITVRGVTVGNKKIRMFWHIGIESKAYEVSIETKGAGVQTYFYERYGNAFNKFDALWNRKK